MPLLTIPLRVHRCLHFWRMTFLEPNAKLLVNITICYCAGLLGFLFWRWLFKWAPLLSPLSLFFALFPCFLLPLWVHKDEWVTPRSLRCPQSPSAALSRGRCILHENWLVGFLSLLEMYYWLSTFPSACYKYIYMDMRDYKIYKYSWPITKILRCWHLCVTRGSSGSGRWIIKAS